MLVRKDNLRRYLYKLLLPATWAKLVHGRFDLAAIRRNVIRFQGNSGEQSSDGRLSTTLVTDPDLGAPSRMRILCVYGAHDGQLQSRREFWTGFREEGRCGHVDEVVVDDADHSFFGWRLKQQVASALGDWVANHGR